MNCMKCGRETQGSNVFCPSCLADMAASPVPAGTPVQIPMRPTPASVHRNVSRKKSPTPEEQLAGLRRALRGLAISVAALALALGVTVTALVHALQEPEAVEAIGQNYITATSSGG